MMYFIAPHLKTMNIYNTNFNSSKNFGKIKKKVVNVAKTFRIISLAN